MIVRPAIAILTAKRQYPEMKIIAISGLVKVVEKELSITARGLINV